MIIHVKVLLFEFTKEKFAVNTSMLEADDIDDDYFTPKPSTSLANIFGGPSNKETANESLKYTPPKKQVQQDVNALQNIEPTPEEDSKATECMFACALTAYEWINNNYSSRGKLGFAILRITKTNSYSIVLYNSNKTTLSNTLVTSKLNMTLKGNNYISYYDNQNKYWSIYGKEEEINKIIEILKTLEVDVKHTLSTDENPPEPNKTVSVKTSIIANEKESDTDSSVNRRTKVSILNRMANMGHSVLPPGPLADKSSDSSDAHELENQPPKIRPKPSKPIMKRTNIEKKVPDQDVTNNIQMPVAKFEQPLSTIQSLNPAIFAMVNGQLVPVSNTNVTPSYGSPVSNEMHLFVTEQRMNNNELRVNINRTTDKVDQVLERLKVLDKSDGDKGNHFHVEIMQKLLTEYENKIKHYEQLLSSKNIKYQQSDLSENVLELESYKTQLTALRSAIEEKDKEIILLNEKNKEQELLVKENSHLKEKISLQTVELEKVYKELDQSRKVNNSQDFENELKIVMNNVYGSLSLNFENDESYSGKNVKKMLASIIKKATNQALSEYNSEN